MHDHGCLKVGWRQYMFDLLQAVRDPPRPRAPPARGSLVSISCSMRPMGRIDAPAPDLDAPGEQKQHDKTTKRSVYRGGSRNNPYLQDAGVSVEFTTTIRPAIMAENIMMLRQEIADEWMADLKLIASENDELMRHHLAMVTEQEDPEENKIYSQLTLDDNSTPLRKSNYDLLCKMVTEYAAVNTVKEMKNRRSEEVAGRWLQKYMDTTAKPLFVKANTGLGQRDVGKTFLQGLLKETPKVVRGTLRDVDEVTLVDPLDIAARIMAERQVLADSWVESLEETEEDNLKLRRDLVESCFQASLASFLPIIPLADRDYE